MEQMLRFIMAKIKEQDTIIEGIKAKGHMLNTSIELVKHMSVRIALMEVLEEGASICGIDIEGGSDE